jgi:hypothetical protein
MQINANTKDVIWKWRGIPSFTLSLSGSTALYALENTLKKLGNKK